MYGVRHLPFHLLNKYICQILATTAETLQRHHWHGWECVSAAKNAAYCKSQQAIKKKEMEGGDLTQEMTWVIIISTCLTGWGLEPCFSLGLRGMFRMNIFK